MSALELLKEYGSDGSKQYSEEEFIGFDDEPGDDKFPLKTFLLEKYGAKEIQSGVDVTEITEECSDSEENPTEVFLKPRAGSGNEPKNKFGKQRSRRTGVWLSN